MMNTTNITVVADAAFDTDVDIMRAKPNCRKYNEHAY
jgi:hypothetical protein